MPISLHHHAKNAHRLLRTFPRHSLLPRVLAVGIALAPITGWAQVPALSQQISTPTPASTACVPVPQPRKKKEVPPPPAPACGTVDACQQQKTQAEKSVLLAQARIERDLSHWDKAADLYAKALQVCPAPTCTPKPCPEKPCPEKACPEKGGAGSGSTTIAVTPWICPDKPSSFLDEFLPWRSGAVTGPPADTDAIANYCYASSETKTWWWTWGKYFPPLRWIYAHPRGSFWLLLILLIVFISPTLLPRGRGLLYWLATLLAWPFRPHFRAQMAIVTPNKLTANAEIDLFAQALLAAGDELNRLFRDQDLGAKPVTMLAMPSSLSSGMQIPTIQGFDIGGMAKFLFTIRRYFAWRLESALAFSPAIKSENSNPSVPARMRAFATIRWGWHVRRSVQIEREVWDQYDVDALAVAVIARGAEDQHLVRALRPGTTRQFFDMESFGLFIEGLRALQCYGAESDQSNPRQPLLNWYINQAIARLREAVEQYPNDILSQFYLGIAATTLNQHIYVSRLCGLSKSVVTYGRYLALKDVRDLTSPVAPKTTPSAAVAQRIAELKAKTPADANAKIAQARNEALDIIEFDKEDWPLLHDADFRFEQALRSTAANNPLSAEERALLQRTILFNLAEVYSRLGTRELIGLAIGMLTNFPPAPAHEPDRFHGLASLLHEGDEQSATLTPQQEAQLLDLKVTSLRLSLSARLAIIDADAPAAPLMVKGPVAAQDPNTALSQLVEHLQAIRDAIDHNSLHLQASDLMSDFCTRVGYVYYELGLHSGARPNVSCDEALHQAEQWLGRALGLKANWNPAQIYLALAYRVHSGVAEAIGDTIAQKRYTRRADRLFTALAGTPVPPPTPRPPTSWRLTGAFAQPGAQATDPPWKVDIEGTVKPHEDPDEGSS